MPLLSEPLGVQLYTLREQLAQDSAGTLTQVAAAGYQHVEAMDTEQLLAIAPICKDLGLHLQSSFYNWTIVTGNAALLGAAAPQHTLDDVIAAALTSGLTDLVFGYLLPQERTSLDDYRRHAERINAAHERIHAAGLTPCYHHHNFEFLPHGASGQTGWDILLNRLDWSVTRLQIDVFWAKLAGLNPAAFITQHADKLRSIHLKDYPVQPPVSFDEQSVDPSTFLPVGAGALELTACLAAARQASVKYWIVEQDASPDPLGDLGRSARCLRA